MDYRYISRSTTLFLLFYFQALNHPYQQLTDPLLRGVPILDPAYCFVRFPCPAYTMCISNSYFFVISLVPQDLISRFHDTIIWLSRFTLTKNRQSRITLRPQWDPHYCTTPRLLPGNQFPRCHLDMTWYPITSRSNLMTISYPTSNCQAIFYDFCTPFVLVADACSTIVVKNPWIVPAGFKPSISGSKGSTLTDWDYLHISRSTILLWRKVNISTLMVYWN